MDKHADGRAKVSVQWLRGMLLLARSAPIIRYAQCNQRHIEGRLDHLHIN